MKKFMATLIMLIILGGAAFFFGWAQLPVPPGSYGVMRSKTHGLDPHIIQEGEFRWVWYKLIPKNVDIQIFTLHTISRSFKTREALPSGSEYASFAGFSVDFSYDLSATLSFTSKPSALLSLMEEKHITDQKDLEVFEGVLAREVEAFALQRLRIYMEDEEKVGEMLKSGSMLQLNSDIEGAFPNIENLSCVMHTANFPDVTLYRQFRSFYESYVERQKEYIRTDKSLQPESRVASAVRLDELAKYGELLTKYPILIQYLAIEKDKP
jgi:hypothetical protein